MHNPLYDTKDKNNIEEQQQLPPQQPDKAIPPYYLYLGVVPIVACVFMCTTYIYLLYMDLHYIKVQIKDLVEFIQDDSTTNSTDVNALIVALENCLSANGDDDSHQPGPFNSTEL